jgi:hypothetical protein
MQLLLKEIVLTGVGQIFEPGSVIYWSAGQIRHKTQLFRGLILTKDLCVFPYWFFSGFTIYNARLLENIVAKYKNLEMHQFIF